METIRANGMPQASAAVPPDSMRARHDDAEVPGRWRCRYLKTLNVSFALFSSARMFGYLPTIWALLASGDASQHSLWTWFTFFGGNTTMAVWLWENNGRRCNSAIRVSGGNALMCLATIVVIGWTRL